MKILIAGSNWLIGSAAARHLIECGYSVIRLVRQAPGPGEIWWNLEAGEIDAAGLKDRDGFVHLASLPWPVRWMTKAKQQMRANRLATNGLLAGSLAACIHKPLWVGRDELAAIVEFTLLTRPAAGPVNAISPNPLGKADLARAACRALEQKWGGALPAFLGRLLMCKMGEELLEASQRIQPARLLAAGYRFRYSHLDQALR